MIAAPRFCSNTELKPTEFDANLSRLGRRVAGNFSKNRRLGATKCQGERRSLLLSPFHTLHPGAVVKPPLKIAVAGLGTVGSGVLQLLDRQAELLSQRAGRRIVVAAVSARDRRRDRGVDLSTVRWYEDAAAMAADPEIDVVVELIGGADGIALRLLDTAFDHGKHVVTANKALMAHDGTRLAARAEEKGLVLSFEAAVAGGIPVIKGLREGLAGNRLERLYGILNGTSNYILTTMRESAHEFAEVLAEAQKLGYAEADPSFDIDGIDAAHKLAILASVGFGRPVDLAGVYAEGIRHVSRLDIDFAEELGYRIKLLGIARLTEEGLEQRVHPCMVPRADADRGCRRRLQCSRRRRRFCRPGGAARARRRRLADGLGGRRRSRRHRARAAMLPRSASPSPICGRYPACRSSGTRAPIISG